MSLFAILGAVLVIGTQKELFLSLFWMAMMLVELLVLAVCVFFASYFNAAFAVGGGFLILAALSYYYPITAVVQLIPAFVIPSLCSRIYLFRQHIHWRITKGFVLGAVVGVLAGAQVLVSMHEAVIMLAMGSLILTLIWFPDVTIPAFLQPNRDDSNSQQTGISRPFIGIGFAHAFLSTLFSVGSIMQSLVMRVGLKKAEITGTLAACLILMTTGKTLTYMWHGFDYWQYKYQILLCATASIIGSYFGKRAGQFISEELFRKVFKWVVSLFAAILVIRGAMLW